MSYSRPVFDSPSLDQQAKWIKRYQIDALKLGEMCELNPGLQKSWDQFILVYNLCKNQDETNSKIP